jgi:hypothetical protein
MQDASGKGREAARVQPELDVAHEPSLSQVLVRPYGAGFAAGYSAALPVCFMNRRMRTRMSGGVGGRQGVTLPPTRSPPRGACVLADRMAESSNYVLKS